MVFGSHGPSGAGESRPKRRTPPGMMEAREWQSRSGTGLSIRLLRDPIIVEDPYSMAKIALAIQLKDSGKTPSIYLPEGKKIPEQFQKFITENGIGIVSGVDIRKHGGLILLNVMREELDPGVINAASTVLNRHGKVERGQEYNYEQVFGLYGKYKEGKESPLPASNTYYAGSILPHEQVFNFIRDQFGTIKKSAAEFLLLDMARITGDLRANDSSFIKELQEAAGMTVEEAINIVKPQVKVDVKEIADGEAPGFSRIDTIPDINGSPRYDIYWKDVHIDELTEKGKAVVELKLDSMRGGGIFLITFFDSESSKFRCRLLIREKPGGESDAIDLKMVRDTFKCELKGGSVVFDCPDFEGPLSNAVNKITEKFKRISKVALEVNRSRAEAELEASGALAMTFGSRRYRPLDRREDKDPINSRMLAEEAEITERPQAVSSRSEAEAELRSDREKVSAGAGAPPLKEKIEKLGFNCYSGFSPNGNVFIYRQRADEKKWTNIIRSCTLEAAPYANEVTFGPRRDIHIIFLVHVDPSTRKIGLLLMSLNDDSEHSVIKRVRAAARYLGMEPKTWQHDIYVELQGKAFGSSPDEVIHSIQDDIFSEFLRG